MCVQYLYINYAICTTYLYNVCTIFVHCVYNTHTIMYMYTITNNVCTILIQCVLNTYTLYCGLSTVHCTMYSVHCTLYCVHYVIQYVMDIVCPAFQRVPECPYLSAFQIMPECPFPPAFQRVPECLPLLSSRGQDAPPHAIYIYNVFIFSLFYVYLLVCVMCSLYAVLCVFFLSV